MQNASVRFSITIGLTLMPAVALAQAPPPPPPRHEVTAEAAFVGVAGNASSNTLGLGGEIIARPGTWMFRHKTSFIRNEAEKVVTAQSFLYNPRAQKTVNDRVGVYGDYVYFRDRFAGVANRNVVTGGVAVKLVNQKSQTLTLDVGAGYLKEERLAGKNVSSGIYTLGSKYTRKLSETADLSEELSLLGNFSHATDWRLTNGVALNVRLSNVLSLKVSNLTRYAHFPATGFKTTDTTTAVALVAKFASKG